MYIDQDKPGPGQMSAIQFHPGALTWIFDWVLNLPQIEMCNIFHCWERKDSIQFNSILLTRGGV